ncbi:MAG: hypothetical protein IIC88_01215 [Chloroflexi bacterium]|nr:hypothetical protein [Chloroflexota bacterium]
MGRKRTAAQKTTTPKALDRFSKALEAGDDWFAALLEAIAHWETPEEVVDGRQYRYLIGGEAFDWLLLAERLCEAANGAIPADEREALLFFGRPPRELDADEFKQAIGASKHRAHLNYLYGVVVEEALQLVVEEEVLKERRSSLSDQDGSVEREVFERIYGCGRDELLTACREADAIPNGDEISYGELREFTYWLFKYRVRQNDPARVASDTRRALARVSQLEVAAQRRARLLAGPETNEAAVVDGEVVARGR